MNEPQYNVIQFLETPYKDIADYVCVPQSWVQTRGPVDPKVKVAYPVEDSLVTEKKVKKRNKKSDQWKSYLSVVKYRTDSYGNAKRYIQELLDNEDEKPRRSSRKPTPVAKVMEALQLIPTPEMNHKSANSTTAKRNAFPDSNKEAHNKRPKVAEPNKFEDEDTGPSNKIVKCELTSDNQLLRQAMSGQDLFTQEASAEKHNEKEIQHRYSTEEKPTVNENYSKINNSLDIERIANQDIFDEFCRSELQELQTNLQVYTTTLFNRTINKIMSNVNAFSAYQFNHSNATISKNSPQKGPKLNENKRNENQENDGEYDDDDDQPLKKASSQKRIKKLVLSPECDENDSRWTLKYREPALGLVELMEHSDVYVNADKLTECKKLSNNCQTLAQMLLTEIFTANALSVCVLSNDFGVDRKHDGPELDTPAILTLLKFVTEYGLEQDWEVNDYHCILDGIRNYIDMKTIGTQEGKKIEETCGQGKSSTVAKRSRKCKFALPPEYDGNDSRWTLKYREPAPGLLELIKHSGVYVNALKLANSKRLSRDCKTLARMLLTEIFTTSALSTCSWTGARAKAFDQDGTNVRPGLDEQARTVLLNYVADRAKKEGWNNNYENQTILNSLRNKMQEIRFKYT